MKKDEIILAIDSLTRVMDMCNRIRLNDSKLQAATEIKLLELISTL